jgi:hypothetical protein
MPYGRHRGRRLAELTETEEGLGYLRWLAETVGGGIARAAEILLQSRGSALVSDGNSCSNVSSSRMKKPAGAGTHGGAEVTP